MKKFINLLLLSFVTFAFLGCNQPTGPSEEELQKQREEQEKLELEQRILNRKKEIWNAIEGVWEIDPSSVGEWEKGTEYKNVIIATDSFTIDGVQQSINLDTDTVLESDLPVDDVYAYGYEIDLEDCEGLVVIFKGVRLNFGAYYIEENDTFSIARRNGNSDDDALFRYVRAGSQDKDDEGNVEGEATELDGTYSYSDSKYNGSISLSNGSWSYEGSKNNAAATSGSYSVNGSSITFNWNANGMDMSETFTITNSGSSSTWVSSETQISNFFMMLFGVIDLELELTKE